MDHAAVERTYAAARDEYAGRGVDTEAALARLLAISLSLHCWQGDDLAGFEKRAAGLAGSGLQVTGCAPGRARDVDELRADMAQAFALIPGRHRVNLHAMYGEFGGRAVDRDAIEPEHFRGWQEWARPRGLKIDLNPTCFAHPRAASGYTLASRESGVRRFWVDHVKCCRKVAASIGREQQAPCLHNLWVPDGSKDVGADRWGARAALLKSLDEIFEVEYSPQQVKDALESKLFGLGSESFVAGSHEFYLGYALTRKKMVCFDLGHFHPTESVADKLSAVLPFTGEVLLHVSRGVRWDSDHVVLLNDEVRDLAAEIVRSQALDRIHIALDYFDASFNRVGAWVLGARAMLKGLLIALLEPRDRLRELDGGPKTLARLSLLEELKALPFGAVWDFHCLKNGVPPSDKWLREVDAYERRVLSRR
ncbi:MAG TPA: L-rhamnose isomerase [Candidatus Aminicenantes bacterium]|nr:L-rhamnose isomerase [Candidatus Aminicenantes bacterium]